jgi:gentisate 1,2-dioxygenase
VWQVFDGDGHISLEGVRTAISRGDVVAVPSWCELAIEAGDGVDLFRFSDSPIFEKLNLARRTTT